MVNVTIATTAKPMTAISILVALTFIRILAMFEPLLQVYYWGRDNKNRLYYEIIAQVYYSSLLKAFINDDCNNNIQYLVECSNKLHR